MLPCALAGLRSDSAVAYITGDAGTGKRQEDASRVEYFLA